jgi:predicted TIM-barrel fold metal-dependent hydrolase
MAANTGHTGPDDAWLATYTEPAIDPDLPIIDSHHHLWLRNGYLYLLPELAADMASGHNIAATVYAECKSMYRMDGLAAERSLGETEFVAGIAAMSESGAFGAPHACAAMFGNVDMTLGGAVEPLLERHLALSGGRFKGVRFSTGWDPAPEIHNVAPAPEMLADPRVREAVGVLDRMGLSLDVWLYHPQLDEVADLARAFPSLTIILNHVGSPILGGPYRDKLDEVRLDWEAAIRRVAACPNVFVKLGAVPMRRTGDKSVPPGSEEVAAAWAPYIEPCIDAFGADRSMFESNFPVQKRWTSYQVTWNAFKRIAAGASDTEKAALFAGAAAKAYRMDGF